MAEYAMDPRSDWTFDRNVAWGLRRGHTDRRSRVRGERVVLPFSAGYRELIDRRELTRSVRVLWHPRYTFWRGQRVAIVSKGGPTIPATITDVKVTQLNKLKTIDLIGGPPDSQTVAALRVALSNSAGQMVAPQADVQVVSFEYEA